MIHRVIQTVIHLIHLDHLPPRRVRPSLLRCSPRRYQAGVRGRARDCRSSFGERRHRRSDVRSQPASQGVLVTMLTAPERFLEGEGADTEACTAKERAEAGIHRCEQVNERLPIADRAQQASDVGRRVTRPGAAKVDDAANGAGWRVVQDVGWAKSPCRSTGRNANVCVAALR